MKCKKEGANVCPMLVHHYFKGFLSGGINELNHVDAGSKAIEAY